MEARNMAEVCGYCGEERKTKSCEVPPPQEGTAAWQGRLCTKCQASLGATVLKAG